MCVLVYVRACMHMDGWMDGWLQAVGVGVSFRVMDLGWKLPCIVRIFFFLHQWHRGPPLAILWFQMFICCQVMCILMPWLLLPPFSWLFSTCLTCWRYLTVADLHTSSLSFHWPMTHNQELVVVLYVHRPDFCQFHPFRLDYSSAFYIHSPHLSSIIFHSSTEFLMNVVTPLLGM